MKQIVTVGGGTGSYTVLSGLKNFSDVSLTALVSMADDGGSTGVLRAELGVLPPGDVRQCLIALSEENEVVCKLMNYRFSEGTLSGHSFGNIFLAALEKVTGSFVEGIQVASGILKVKGTVVPITIDKAELSVVLKDGSIVEGQVKITDTNLQDLGLQKIFYKQKVLLSEAAKTAILKADYIIIGPGNY
ncbi:MAG: gluconeogenesis factor YvcK family protein, partial [Candidatus Paceibacterota bacterium]